MVIDFFMPMKKVPTVTHQEKQIHVVNGKPVFYEPDDLKAARAKLLAHLGQHVPEKRFTGPIRLTTWWCFPVTGKHKNGEYKTSKPDTDNLTKLLLDCMTSCGFWKDDSLVVSLVAEKYYADLPGIYIRIQDVQGD